MEFFDYFLIVSLLIIAGMIIFTVCAVLRNKRFMAVESRQGTEQKQKRNVSVDWRVYALDTGGNCFSGSEIILEKEKDEFVIGRQLGCQLRIMKAEIGRRHARVKRKGIVYTYSDLGSYAGSVCEQIRIKNKRLHHMMVVWIYDVALVFANCEVPQEELADAIKKSPKSVKKC